MWQPTTDLGAFLTSVQNIGKHGKTMRNHATAWTQQTLQISRYTILTYAELLYSVGDFEASRKCGTLCFVQEWAEWGYWTWSLSIVSIAEKTWENVRKRQCKSMQIVELAHHIATPRYFSMAAYLDEMNLRALWGLATCNMAGDSGDCRDWDIDFVTLCHTLSNMKSLWYSKTWQLWQPWTCFSTSTHHTWQREFLAAEALAEKDKAREKLLGLTSRNQT